MSNLDLLMPTLPGSNDVGHRFGTVTAVNPLTVLLDGDTESVSGGLISLTSVSKYDRIMGLFFGTQLVIVGRVNGDGAPVGSIVAWAGGITAPFGYLLCDGGQYSTTDITYKSLYEVIGTTYGSGTGTFKVPDLKGRVIVGHHSSNPENYFKTFAVTGGASTHTLTVAEMPSHSHGPSGTIANFWGYSTSWEASIATTSGGLGIRGGSRTGSEGGGAAHNNLQPYMVMNYIIKY